MSGRGRSRSPGRRRRTAAAKPVVVPWREAGALELARRIVMLSRPQFLVYSLVCHLLGALAAAAQGQPLDLRTLVFVQATVWSTHVTAHFLNEWADYEADAANANAGDWSGGSQVLVKGLLPRSAALILGALSCLSALLNGTAAATRFVLVRHAVAVDWTNFSSVTGALSLAPWGMIVLGFSVLAIAAAYSLPPFRLSANALGECCVAYVLSFCVPMVGLFSQNGRLSARIFELLLPFIVVSFARMVVMNIGDRAGDAAVGKRTSVVWLGEQRAVLLVDVMHLATYCAIVPQLHSLSYTVRLAHYATLPLRWWQSIRLNSLPGFWHDPALVRSIPKVESLLVLSHAAALCVGLALDIYVYDAIGAY